MGETERYIEEIADFLHVYLKNGYVTFDSFSKKIHPDLKKFKELLLLRFLLHDETKEFAKQLPALIRHFKTVTTMQQQTNIAEIRGAIDWPETMRTRLHTNYKDTLTYVTQENIRSYDTQENIVLKTLLTILHRKLYENHYIKKFHQATWFTTWQLLRKNIDDVLRTNIYLQRVSTVTLTERMIHNTTKHRNPLYRKAANLLARYNRFQRGEIDPSELEQLLRETFIIPDEIDVLFELYWVIQLIKQNTDESTLYLIDGRENIVASWEKDHYEYAIYHDSMGPSDLSFLIYGEELLEGENEYAQQLYKSFQQANEYGSLFFNRPKSEVFVQGRPDIIITIRHSVTKELVKVIIGEVKHTKRTSYAMTGLRELLDYINLVKYKQQYMAGKVSIAGILFADEVEINEVNTDDRLIEIVTPSLTKNLQL